MITTLYKIANTGKIQEWSIELSGNKYRTISGQLDGKKTTSEFTVCSGKNIGRANETTPQQQAATEVQSKIQKKLDGGYCFDLESVGKASYFEPMLAKEYGDYQAKLIYPLYCQPKLDGIRCIVTKDGMFSRKGKPMVAAPHIKEELDEIFEEYPDFIFDGELYNHNFRHDFDKICSLVRKTKPTDEDLKESAELIEYHLYDGYLLDETFRKFSDRYECINFFHHRFLEFKPKTMIKLVDTAEVPNVTILNHIYEVYLENGYEGQMIRLDTPYENKRTKNLLKRKEFIDGEWPILDIVEGVGNRSGMAGYMCFEQNRQPFKSNIKGDRDYLRELLNNKDKYIGQLATIKYFNLTPGGIPRFPAVKEIRNYE